MRPVAICRGARRYILLFARVLAFPKGEAEKPLSPARARASSPYRGAESGGLRLRGYTRPRWGLGMTAEGQQGLDHALSPPPSHGGATDFV